MIVYLSTFTNTNGMSFPNTAAVNVSTPGAGDGTEFISAFVDDAWGARQALMNTAGIAPNGSTESASASQYVQALTDLFGMPGTVVGYYGQGAPSLWNYPLLLLEGQGVNRNTYDALDAVCWVGSGDNGTAEYFYRADDAGGTIRNSSGLYIILPDTRGAFLRGWDPTATRDPQGATRTFPDFQDRATEAHSHNVEDASLNRVSQQSSSDFSAGAKTVYHKGTGVSTPQLFATSTSITGAPTDSQENRPQNLNIKWAIRY